MTPQDDVLLRKAKAGDREAEYALLVSKERVILGIARTWRIPGLSHEDIVQEARLGALTAIREFQPGRGDLTAFMRRCIPRYLQKIKESRQASKDEPGEVELSVAAVIPSRELEIIRLVWPHLSEAERRGVLVTLDEGSTTIAAENLGVTKQAISHGWTSAQSLINLAVAEGMEAVCALRPKVKKSPLDWQLEMLLARLCVE